MAKKNARKALHEATKRLHTASDSVVSSSSAWTGRGTAVMPREGVLQQGDFCTLLGLALATRATGRLVLEQAGTQRSVVICSGRPVWAKSSNSAESIARRLLREGALERKDYDAAVRRFGTAAEDLDELVKEGVLGAEELENAERMACDYIVRLCTGWGGTTFRWEPLSKARAALKQTELSPLSITLDWLEHLPAEKVVGRVARHRSYAIHGTQVIKEFPDYFGRGALGETLVSDALRDKTTVAELLAGARAQIDGVARLVYALLTLRAIQLERSQEQTTSIVGADVARKKKEKPRPEAPPAPPSTSFARDRLCEILFLDGLTYLKIGDRAEALDHFSIAMRRQPNDVRFQAYCAWVEYLDAFDADDEVGQETGRGAIEALAEQAEEGVVEPHFVLGQLLNRLGDNEGAKLAFNTVLRYAPDHAEAKLAVSMIP